MKRIVAAFLLAPLAVPLAVTLLLAAASGVGDQVMLGPVIALYTVPVTLVAGVPALLVFRRMRWGRLWQFALGGALIGIAPILVEAPPLAQVGTYIGLYGGIGLVSAALFWLIGVRNNPWYFARECLPVTAP